MDMVRRLAMAGVAVGGLIAVGALLANVGPRPTATLATGGSNVATNAVLNGTGSTTPGASGRFGSGWGGRAGSPGFGDWGGRHGHFGFGRGLTVTGVSGNTITATGRGGQTVTVQVSATTAYTEAGASASLSDIKTGSVIAVQGSYA